MSDKNDDDQDLNPKDLVFILAIAGRLDARSKLLAEKLDKNGQIYHAYAALDALSSSYSMFKYWFDAFASTTSADHMHDVMMSPGGIAAISAESLFLVTFSLLASRFDGEKTNEIKKFIATAWIYVRDVIKGLKNAYKGWRSSIQAIGQISGLDLKYLITPVGLVLGVFAAANRLLLRYLIESRKAMMKNNSALILKIIQNQSLTHEERDLKLHEIKTQTNSERYQGYVAVAIGGLIDGLYMYVGVLGLAIITAAPVFATMFVLSSIYTLACVITRVYEEYDYQLKLQVVKTKCELAITSKLLETYYEQLLKLKAGLDQHPEYAEEIHDLQLYISSLITKFDSQRQSLQQQTSRSSFVTGLMGLKNGLYAYSASTSLLFLVGAIITITGATFPPILLILSVSLGIGFVVGFTIQALRTKFLTVNTEEPVADKPYGQLLKMRDDIENKVACSEAMDMDCLQDAIIDGVTLKTSPRTYFQEWFEVIRSLFSGFGKGQKFVGFAFNPLQETGDDGHYHDTPVMYVLSAIGTTLFSVVLALRALGRGLGRPLLGQVDLVEEMKKERERMQNNADDTPGNESKNTEQKVKKADEAATSSPKVTNLSSPKRPGFFKLPSKPVVSSMHHSVSSSDLPRSTTPPL